MTADFRDGQWDVVATAGTSHEWVLTWTTAAGAAFDVSAGVSVWIGGTTADQNDFTGATEYAAVISGVGNNVATVTPPIPDSGTSRLRVTHAGHLVTVGKLAATASGSPAPGGDATFVADDISVSVTVVGSSGGGGGGGGGAVDSVNGRTGVVTGLAEQSSLTAEAALARNADNLTSGTVADARIAATIARDSEVTSAVAAEATLARNADNLTSGTVADARIASTIARDSEVTAAVAAHEADTTSVHGIADTSALATSASVTAAVAAEATLARNADNITSGTVADARIASTIARDSEVVLQTLADAKGDLLVGTAADTVGRLAVGTDTHVLTADSTQATGVKWAAAAGGASFPLTDAAATAATVEYQTKVTVDSNNRHQITAGGKASWGPGNAATDVDLERDAPGRLAVTGRLSIIGSATLGNPGMFISRSITTADTDVPSLKVTDAVTFTSVVVAAGLDFSPAYTFNTGSVAVQVVGASIAPTTAGANLSVPLTGLTINPSPSGNITSNTCLEIKSSGAGTPTTLIGLKMTGLGNGTTKWGLQVGDYQSHHTGRLALGGSTAPTYGLELQGTAQDRGVIALPEASATPTNPSASNQWLMYSKADKLVFAFNNAGTVRYYYLDGTVAGGTWTHTTTAP